MVERNTVFFKTCAGALEGGAKNEKMVRMGSFSTWAHNVAFLDFKFVFGLSCFLRKGGVMMLKKVLISMAVG